LFFAFIFIFLTSFFDVIDGAVAKVTHNVTKLGGFLDSTIDRYSDSVILIGLALFLEDHYGLIFIVLVGSLLVSYTRARAEEFVPKCDIGIAERSERLIFLMIATFLAAYQFLNPLDIFYTILIILAILTHFTVLQRIYYTYNLLR
jgi:phosphatidylglycerophosphate synthase